MHDPSGPIRTPRRRGIGRATTLAVATTALVAGAGLPIIATAQAESIAPKRIGSAPVAPKGAVKASAPADTTQVNLSVTLQPRDQAALTAFVNAVSNPASPSYKHYLGTGEFGKRFGADATTVASVRQALTAAGLHPGELGPDGLTIPVKTTVAGAKKAFDTDFVGYKLANGSTGFANTKAPAVRGDLAGRIAGLVGLDTTVTYKPRSVVKPSSHVSGRIDGGVQAHNIGATPGVCASEQSQISGMTDGQDYYSPSALAKTYGLDGLPDGGSGATVAVLSLENYDPNGVSAYQSCNNTKASVTNIPVAGFQTAPPNLAKPVYEGFETALDVETIASLAPGSSILVYQGPNSATGIIDTAQQIVNDNRAKVVSISWGLCEAMRSFASQEQPLNLVLQQAATQGQTVLAASGDDGSADCGPGDLSTVVNTDSPASQPYVTGVGGTSHTGIGSNMTNLRVWNNGGAGGGGVSHYWALPDADFPWNKNQAPQYSNVCSAVAGQTCRQVPDVSALADFAHGYLVVPTVVNGQPDVWTMGGTSGAAPLWAALVADANASTACAANGPVGFLNPVLHSLPSSDFTDVTVGNNDITGSGLYSAAPGYDLASGLGMPNGKALIPALCKAVPAQPAGTYNPVAPTRLLDTRKAIGAPQAKIPARGTLSLSVAGRGGVPATNVTAVVLNVTVAGTTGPGFLTAYPSGKTLPDSSNLNWPGGRDVPNLVTVQLGGDGKVNLFNGAWSSVDLVADVFGYYSADSNGSTLTPVAPTRLLDTRYGTGAPQAKLGSHQTLDLAIPGTGVKAVVLNTTVTRTENGGFLTAYPSGTTRPDSSNLNWVTGQTVPNLVIVPVGANGNVTFYNGGPAAIDLIADIFGVFTQDASGGKFHAAGPTRMMDTRSGKGAPGPAPLGNGQIVHLSLNDGNSLSSATSVVLNVTVANTTASGVLNVWPGYDPRPSSSNLNWDKGQVIANLVTVPVKNGAVDLALTSYGTANVIVDLFGYYSAN